MNISEDFDIAEMGQDRTKAEKGVSWKLHNDSDPDCPQECVVNDVNTEKGATLFDAPASGVLHTCSTKKEKIGTSGQKLDRVA